MVYGPPGNLFWSTSNNESFVLGFVSPLLPHRPWKIRGTPKVLVLVRAENFLIQQIPGDIGSVLFQLWLLTKRVVSMSRSVGTWIDSKTALIGSRIIMG